MSEKKVPMSREEAREIVGKWIALNRQMAVVNPRCGREGDALQLLLDREDRLTDAAQQVEQFHYASHIGYTLLDAFQVVHAALKSLQPQKGAKADE